VENAVWIPGQAGSNEIPAGEVEGAIVGARAGSANGDSIDRAGDGEIAGRGERAISACAEAVAADKDGAAGLIPDIGGDEGDRANRTRDTGDIHITGIVERVVGGGDAERAVTAGNVTEGEAGCIYGGAGAGEAEAEGAV